MLNFSLATHVAFYRTLLNIRDKNIWKNNTIELQLYSIASGDVNMSNFLLKRLNHIYWLLTISLTHRGFQFDCFRWLQVVRILIEPPTACNNSHKSFANAIIRKINRQGKDATGPFTLPQFIRYSHIISTKIRIRRCQISGIKRYSRLHQQQEGARNP